MGGQLGSTLAFRLAVMVGTLTTSVFVTPAGVGASPERSAVEGVKARTPHDYSGDGCADILGFTPDHRLLLYRGTCHGALTDPVEMASGWDDVDAVVAAGDMDGDHCDDVAVRQLDGDLLLRRGDCAGGLLSDQMIGTGWQDMITIISADMDGNGCTELLGVQATGLLFWYPYNCFRPVDVRFAYFMDHELGNGWEDMTLVAGAGDLNSNSEDDVLGRTEDGRLLYYRSGAVSGGTFLILDDLIGFGIDWQDMTAILGAGDLDSDGCDDLVARAPDGTLLRYSGSCDVQVADHVVIGNGWQDMLTII